MGASATAATDREAATEIANEIVLRDHQCKEKIYIRKTKTFMHIFVKRKRKKESSRNLHWHKWNADAAEGDELKVQTQNKSRDKKESMK